MQLDCRFSLPAAQHPYAAVELRVMRCGDALELHLRNPILEHAREMASARLEAKATPGIEYARETQSPSVAAREEVQRDFEKAKAEHRDRGEGLPADNPFLTEFLFFQIHPSLARAIASALMGAAAKE